MGKHLAFFVESYFYGHITAIQAWNENTKLAESAVVKYDTLSAKLTNLKNKALVAGRQIARDEQNPNAVCWVNDKGRGCSISAKPFCNILYEITGWDREYSYRVQAILRRKKDETVLFFDLDNYIGKEIRPVKTNQDSLQVILSDRRIESEETRGIFYGAEDDEPQPIEDTEEIERKLRERNEYEKRNFGTPAFKHNSEFRLTAIDDEGEWDVMISARPLDSDHRVDEREIEALQDEMLEKMIESENDEEKGEEP